METTAPIGDPRPQAVDENTISAPPSRGKSVLELSSWPIVIALIVRLALVMFVLTRHPGLSPDRLFWTADTRGYVGLATSLLRGEFSNPSGPETYRLPGYPLFLSPGIALGWPTTYALVAQSLLCCLLVVIVICAARVAGLEDRAATAAGILCALEPTLLLWSLQLMADAPLGAIVAATFLALLLYLRDGSGRMLLLATALAAGSALVKPVAYGLVIVVAFIASFVGRARSGLAALRLFMAVVMSGVLILGAWQARNWSVGGQSGFSAQISHAIRSADFEIWRSEHPRARGDEIRGEWHRLGLDNPAGGGPPIQMDSALVRRAEFHLRGVWRTLSNPGVVTWLQFLDLEPLGMAASRDLMAKGPLGFLMQSITRRPLVVAGSIILGVVSVAYWVLFMVGFGKLMRQNRSAALAAGLLIGYFAFAAGGPWGQSRFRIAFVSALCVVAATGFDRGTGSASPQSRDQGAGYDSV